jgi:hypothetical protein
MLFIFILNEYSKKRNRRTVLCFWNFGGEFFRRYGTPMRTLYFGVRPPHPIHKHKRDICIVLYCIILSCLVLSCLVLYCLVLSCLVLSCIVLYCIVLYCIVLYCIVLYRIVSYRIILYHIVLY